MTNNSSIWVLGIDGGATKSSFTLVNQEYKYSKIFSAPSINTANQKRAELKKIFHQIRDKVSKNINGKLVAVSACLAGANEKHEISKIKNDLQTLWKPQKIFISHDMDSALFAGIGSADGIVAISGTGSCTYGRFRNKSYKAGGWGELIGDSGSAYHIAHSGIRSVFREYDKFAKVNALGRRLLRDSNSPNLPTFAKKLRSHSKREIAFYCQSVFECAKKNDEISRQIIQHSAKTLAEQIFVIWENLGRPEIPVTIGGSVLRNSDFYKKLFHQELLKIWPDAILKIPELQACQGAALIGLHKIKKSKISVPSSKSIRSRISSPKINLSHLPTEKTNPRTKDLSKVKTSTAIELLICEDERFLMSSIKKAKSKISKVISAVSHSFQTNGRLIYVGAGTSGRLGVLDASECVPTFGVSSSLVQGIIAGGDLALKSSIEGSEDNFYQGTIAIKRAKINPSDVVLGISASGRTPFVLGALQEADKIGAYTALLDCSYDSKETVPTVKTRISLPTGPESICGSTRMRAGTATKIVLNLISTLSMVNTGRVLGNQMIHMKTSNEKLKARALKLVIDLSLIHI